MKYYYKFPSNVRASISRDNIFSIVVKSKSSQVSTQGPNGPLDANTDHEGFNSWFQSTGNVGRLHNDFSPTTVLFGEWKEQKFKIFAVVHYNDKLIENHEDYTYPLAIACQREPDEIRRILRDLGFYDFNDIMVM